MATAYDLAFKYEILNEVIAHVQGLISRKFPDNLPSDIARLNEEVLNIYHNMETERVMAVLDKYDKRLLEIRDYIQNRDVKASNKRMVG